MRNIARVAIGCLLSTLVSRSVAATIDITEIEIPNSSTVATSLETGEHGAWRSRTQQVFDTVERSLVRRQYIVWDPQPSRNLDFAWVPDTPVGDRDGLISGRGRLIWRMQGKPAYDPASVFGEYYGDVKDGRAEGHGTYFDKTGMRYIGAWRNGVMEGRGRLVLPSTDEYIGQFRGGKANGAGRYTDATGETFEGTFANGLREGGGTTKLPDGDSYRSNWMNGEETVGSRAVRIAQIGSQTVAERLEEIRIPVEIESANEAYTSYNEGASLGIRPGERVFNVWKGNDDFQTVSLQYGGGPLDFKFGVHNRSTRLQYIAGAYLEVSSSKSDLQPAITADVGRRDQICGASLYGPTIAFANFGWSAADSAILNLTFALANTTTPPPAGAPRISRRLGRIDKEFTVDLEPDLAAVGVNVPYLKSRARGTLCTSANRNACIQQLKSSGIFGTLSNLVDTDGDEASVRATGSLEYDWTDHRGDKRRRTSKLDATITLGRLSPPPTGCAEQAGPEVVIPKPLMFRLDQTGYRIPISFSQRPVAAGSITWFKLPLNALKASQHEFRVFVRMADGAEFPSRPIKFLYYVPSWGNSRGADKLPLAGLTFAVPTLWSDNGSTLALEADGPNRVFYYTKPKPSLGQLAIQQGTLLFTGRRVGDRYEGTARVFKCFQSFEYAVSGRVSSDQREIVMEGEAPRVDDNCKVNGYWRDTLKMTSY